MVKLRTRDNAKTVSAVSENGTQFEKVLRGARAKEAKSRGKELKSITVTKMPFAIFNAIIGLNVSECGKRGGQNGGKRGRKGIEKEREGSWVGANKGSFWQHSRVGMR